MALPHAPSGDVIDVQSDGAHVGVTQSVACRKAGQLDLVRRLARQLGQRARPHRVPRKIAVAGLQGSAQVRAVGKRYRLAAPPRLYARGRVPRALVAPLCAPSVPRTVAL